MSDITAQLVQLPNISTVVKKLFLTTGREWREDKNDTGFGSLVFQNDDPALASIVGPNNLVNFYVKGVLAFTILLDQYAPVEVAEGEEAQQVTRWSGPGHIALMDRIEVYPGLGVLKRPIEQQRTFNYTANAYDDSGPEWVAATSMCTVADAQTGTWDAGTPGTEWDAGYPDPTAVVLGPSTGTAGNAPEGSLYGRDPFTLASGGQFTLNALMDNYGEVYIDGVLVLSPGQSTNLEIGFLHTSKVTLELTAGAHLLSWKVTNGPGNGTDNPVGVAYSLYESDALGVLGTLKHNSTTACQIVEYPAEAPGMTPGAALELLRAEGAARVYVGDTKAIAGLVTFSFDADVDTNGAPWSVIANMATKVGNSMGGFLRELSLGTIDFYMAPGTLVLDAWIKGTRGSGTSAVYDSGVNISRLERTGEV